jgi:hypothetical protein
VPATAVVQLGNQTYCYLYEDGKAAKTPIQTGVSDGKWVEVFRKQVKGAWTEVAGTDQFIEGQLTELVDGQAVRVAEEGQ